MMMIHTVMDTRKAINCISSIYSAYYKIGNKCAYLCLANVEKKTNCNQFIGDMRTCLVDVCTNKYKET